MHHTTMESNHPLSEVVSLPALSTGKHNLEEGDQLVILNALDVMHKKQQSILDVFSVDTDVFVLLTAHFSLIRRGGERIRIQESYMKLGQKRAVALLGWYAFKGTDNTGSFAGKGVACRFKAFLQADDGMLDAFANFVFSLQPHLGYIDRWRNMYVYCTRSTDGEICMSTVQDRQMGKYVCLLYKIDRWGNMSTVQDRQYLVR